jgi:hypothetical protein
MGRPTCTHRKNDSVVPLDAFCPGAGPRVEYPSTTTVMPSCDFNRPEASYHRQQEAALRYLHGLWRVRPNVDMWYLMGPFYECLGRCLGRPIDAGRRGTSACMIYLRALHDQNVPLVSQTVTRPFLAAVSYCLADAIVV